MHGPSYGLLSFWNIFVKMHLSLNNIFNVFSKAQTKVQIMPFR